MNDLSLPHAGQQTRAPLQRLTLLALCLAVLVAQVDTAIINLAARPIGMALAAETSQLQWVVDSYNLVYASLLLTGGLLADLRGRRLVFMIGAALFTVASVICTVAPEVTTLIAGRALAGLGAALLIPASLALIRVVWPDQATRGRVLGIWAACNGVALAIGPTLGGVLIHVWGWRSVFLAVVPFSVAAVVLAALYVPESADPQARHFDPGAQLTGALALATLAFAAIEAHARWPWAVAALIVCALAAALFVRIEKHQGKAALVPLDLFGIAAFRGAAAGTIGMTFGMYAVLFLLPLTWQGSGQLSTTAAGLALMPMALVFVLVSPFSGAGTRHWGVRSMTCGGVLVIAGGLALIGLSAGSCQLLIAEIGLALTGLGMGMATGPLMGAAVGAVQAARAGTASSLINVARMAGATLGVAILGAIYTMAGGGPAGLRAAMATGVTVQLVCVALAWRHIGTTHT
ncbi:MFS transporter [Silvimonas iriomotensis]|uniref:Drug resistance transporter, EmrB/QacA family protein n=1 Tax=Silvimonas iriomotensis TaxID=449662 RepID=A0ABQ2P984_9NEIS|nr:MFS transporter [Silvimonas iriomotensis]GGP21497.1 putative drug resistance transporter, EmrB/QacA family protein [Silvimonas iriomotensis]